MRWLRFFLVAGLITLTLGIFKPVSVFASPMIDCGPGGVLTVTNTTNAGAQLGNSTNVWASQSFSPAANGQLTQITVAFGLNSGTPTGTVTWNVSSNKEGIPGTSLASGTFTPTPNATNTITVVSGPNLLTSNLYYFVLSPTTVQTASNRWMVGMNNADPYNGGLYLQTANSGSSWTLTVADDLVMTVTTSSCGATSTPTNTATYTYTPSNTPLPTATYTPSLTPSNTPLPTATYTPSLTPSNTLVSTATYTPSLTPSDTSTATDTYTPSMTPSDTPTATDTYTPSVTPSATLTSTFTPSYTATFTLTFTPSTTLTPSDTPTATDTGTLPPTNTPTITLTPTITPSPTNTPTPTPNFYIEATLSNGQAGASVMTFTDGQRGIFEGIVVLIVFSGVTTFLLTRKRR